jgi:hypothetical protein
VVFQVRIGVEILWLEPLWSSYINMHYYVGLYLFERRVQAHSEFRNMSAVYCNDESCKCQRIKVIEAVGLHVFSQSGFILDVETSYSASLICSKTIAVTSYSALIYFLQKLTLGGSICQ